MSGQDAKLFARGKVAELRAELEAGGKKDKNFSAKKIAMKKIVANMTMNNTEMVALFPDVIAQMQIPSLDIKKMCFLYLVNYGRIKPDMALKALPFLTTDLEHDNPLIRALALRTISYIHVKEYVESLHKPLQRLLKDNDPYVRKTAAFTVAKMYEHDKRYVENSDFIDRLNTMLRDENPTVIASALAALTDIWQRSESIKLTIDYANASNIVQILPDCSEWGQVYILEAMMNYIPQDTSEATILAERIVPRLSHQNSAVVLNCVRVLLYLFNYMSDETIIKSLCARLSPSLVTLLSKGPEIQYLALRNILLILQRYPDVLRNETRVFFCKYNDPIYVKVTKLELLFTLANPTNINEVLAELREYATEIDVHFVRKSVRAIGKLAIKIEPAARACIDTLLSLVATKVSYIVQEATVVIKNIFRKYPNRYESIIGTLCEHLDSLDEPEAKAAMIWIIGQYADRISNSADLLEDFLFSFKEETYEVQLALLTATVKLFLARPTKGATLVPKVLKWATEETDHPDLRERGYFYWRLLSYATDTTLAKQVVMGEKPAITAEAEKLDPQTLQEMCLNIGTLATIYLKPVKTVFRNARERRLEESRALQKDQLPVEVSRRERTRAGTSASMLERQRAAQAAAGKNPFGEAMHRQSGIRDISSPSLMGGANGDFSAAVDAADEYFSRLNTGMANMNMGVGDDDLMSPQGPGGGGQGYGFVANQSQYGVLRSPIEDGDGEEDLLKF